MINFRKIRNLYIIIALFWVLISSETFAYEYEYKWKAQYIDWTIQTKVDIFFSNKVKTIDIANKYIAALNKYEYKILSVQSQKIVDYLLYKLELYKNPSKSVIYHQNLSSNSWDSENSLITNLKKYVKDYVEISNDYEFIRDQTNYLLDLTEDQYYIINLNVPIESYLKLPSLNDEILFKKWDGYYVSKWWFSFDKKISIDELKTKVKLYKETIEPMVIELDDGTYYADNLSKYSFFQIPENWFYLKQYPKISNLSSSILLNKNWVYQIVPTFPQKKLFFASMLDWAQETDLFLKYLWNDVYNYTGDDIETMMANIKAKSISLTSWNLTSDDKIKNIYSWITSNISYDPFSLAYVEWKIDKTSFETSVDTNVFSWIWAYKTKNAVCDGYSHLLFYMLSFAWIPNVSIETWEANTWNNVWIPHAWNKIWDYYYDSTWDIDSGWKPSQFKWYKKTSDEFFTLRRKNS